MNLHSRSLLCVFSLLAGTAAWAQEIQWLPEGAEYTFKCSGTISGDRTWKVTANRDGQARAERVGSTVAKVGPVWALLLTDISDELDNGRPAKTMKFVSGDKDGLKSLAVGTSVRAEYEWVRDNNRANRTHTVKVEEKKTLKTPNFGEQEVYVVSDTITGRIHNIKQITHYSPALKTFTYLNFNNYNTRDRYECDLTKLSLPGS